MKERSPALHFSRLGLVASIFFLAALVVFSILHVGEMRRFARLAEQAEPAWLLLAVACQLGTYLCAGAIWGRVAAAAGHHIPRPALARASVEKLSVDQFVPTGGLSGNLVVLRAMRRAGLPPGVALEALLIDLLSHYAAFAVVVAGALLVLWLHHHVTPVILGLLGIFAVLVALVPSAIVWMLHDRDWRPGRRLGRIRPLVRLLEVVGQVSTERIGNRRLLGAATALQIGIFLLDAFTLWAVLRALGTPVHVFTSFAAVVVATAAGTLSLLPGGVGGFEAGATATLALLGVPVEAALTGTLLFRGLSLWLPLAPGVLLARRDIAGSGPRSAGTAGVPDATASREDLLAQLRTRSGGLRADEAERRLEELGPNTIAPRASTAVFREFARVALSPLALVLLAAATASAFLGQAVDAAIIAAVVLLSAAINFWQSARSARAVRRLRAQVTLTATVFRDGARTTIPRAEVVIGDVVELAAGDLVPADARLLECADLHVEQAALTGESLPVEKRAAAGPIAGVGSDAVELVHAGTSVVSGTGTAVVFATGARTGFGAIAARLAERPEETEFERGARHFGLFILQTVSFLVLFILVVNTALGRDAFQSVLFAVALAVGLTPEYLPMITTVTLAQGAARMAEQKVIVKHLAAIQNLGSMDVLCSDKTGTLTSGRMSLDAALDPFGAASERPLALARLNSAFESGVRSALDQAILAGADDVAAGWSKAAEVPFDFERRRLSVAVERDGARLLVTKGAPEGVLACCTRLERGAEVDPLGPDARAECVERFRQLSGAGYRVLAVAWKELSPAEPATREAEADLVLAGFVTFADQLLEGVGEAIEHLRADGVAVKILSGDNELVTRTLCAKVGVDAERIVLGDEVERLGEAALARVAEEVSVFARVSPVQKHRIVMALKHHGHVVGFMGDGINDAPSLHGADVGISVSGAVDVAQEASDILLLEHRLGVLHAGIVAGRRSFANVLKYLLMGTSSNFGNMLSMAGAVFFLPFLPMLPTQILVNNFLYDLAQITIPTDNVDPAYLKRPQRSNIRAIRRFMLLVGPISSIFDFLTFAVLLLVFRFNESLFQTGWFVESLTTQVLVLFVIRTAGRPWANRPSVPLVVTALVVVTIGTILPWTPLAPLLGMAPLPARFLVLAGAVIPAYLTLVELVKRKVMRRLV